MMTSSFIEDQFRCRPLRPSDGHGPAWLFEPLPNSELKHRYIMSFVPRERRFVLSRQEVVPFMSIADGEVIEAFRGAMPAEAIADCTRMSLEAPLNDPDDIPF